jgi:phospholipid/cholesterol/gamma-HCH transport system permease protein
MGNKKNKQQTAAILLVEENSVRCMGNWTVADLHALEQQLPGVQWPEQARLTFDMRDVQHMDTSGAWLLVRTVRDLEAQGTQVSLHGLAPGAKALFDLVREADGVPRRPPRAKRTPLLITLGQGSLLALIRWGDMVAFIGEIGESVMRVLRQPVRIRWAAVLHELAQAGHKALPIVGLLAFLLGIVIGYQSGVQLRNYGANIFVVDLVGLSMLRELAPLITAIIVAGRTGSAYTAEIGTMQVTEEIDAMRSLGIAPMELLVLPKLIALLIALPLLTVYADIVGVFGGMVMANVQLDMTYITFLERFDDAVSLDSYLVGIGKAPVFAAIVATVGCYQGFQVSGSAESVGRRTTLSVVQSILAVIIVDAAFSVAFSYLDI